MLRAGEEILIYETAQDVAVAAAKLLIELPKGLEQRSLKPRVALSGGSTPKAMYQHLSRMTGEDALLLRKIRYFFGDERAVPHTDPESNVKAAREGFLLQQGVPYNQVYAPDGGAPDLAAEAHRLTQLLCRTLPNTPTPPPVPQFDLIFLGMGNDGHTASLFPGTTALRSEIPGYVANQVPQLKTWRLTLTYPVLNAAHHLALLIPGKSKAPVLKEIFSRGHGDKVYPIEWLRARKTSWMLDMEAASELPRELLRIAQPIR